MPSNSPSFCGREYGVWRSEDIPSPLGRGWHNDRQVGMTGEGFSSADAGKLRNPSPGKAACGRLATLARRERGVTLIELIAVLIILGLAIALASPSLFASVDRFQLNSAGHQLVDSFRLARNEARFGQEEILGVVTEHQFVILRGTSRVSSVSLPLTLEARPSSGQAAYSFLPSGQILGPERLELLGPGRNRGVVILGPPPGTVHFELRR